VFQETFPILTTRDLRRSLDFYERLLGGQVRYRFPDEGEPAYVSLVIGTTDLGIGVDDRPTVNDRIALWVYADDCDDAVAHLRDAGVEVVQEPTDQPWGERMAIVHDPDGNQVIVASRGLAVVTPQGRAGPPRVLTPAVPLTEKDGRIIYVITVELWRNEVLVRLAGVPAWRDDGEPEIGSATGEDFLLDLQLGLSDDLGTVYEPDQSMANGSGYEWRSDWHLRPGVPAGAKRLTVALLRDPERRVDLDLEEQRGRPPRAYGAGMESA
jgi:lactoylglutathione lyase